MNSIRLNFPKRASCLVVCQILCTLCLATSFLLENPRSMQRFKIQESFTSSLQGKFQGRDEFYGIGELNKARTDIRNFLSQRALQSFIFLLSHCRDTATVQWLEVSQFQPYLLEVTNNETTTQTFETLHYRQI